MICENEFECGNTLKTKNVQLMRCKFAIMLVSGIFRNGQMENANFIWVFPRSDLQLTLKSINCGKFQTIAKLFVWISTFAHLRLTIERNINSISEREKKSEHNNIECYIEQKPECNMFVENKFKLLLFK